MAINIMWFSADAYRFYSVVFSAVSTWYFITVHKSKNKEMKGVIFNTYTHSYGAFEEKQSLL